MVAEGERFGECPKFNSLRILRVLGVSAVIVLLRYFTAEAQSAQSRRRDKTNSGHYFSLCVKPYSLRMASIRDGAEVIHRGSRF